MPSKNYCRICQYWRKYSYKVSEKELFEKKCRENVSLRKLELLLEAYGLQAKKDLIRKHIKNCMNLEVSEQRRKEKQLAKEKGLKSIGKKLTGFFIPKKEDPVVPNACLHIQTRPAFDLSTEKVYAKCLKCGKVLRGSANPHGKRKARYKDRVVLESLRK